MHQITGTVIEVDGLSCCRDSRILFQNLSFSATAGNLINIVGNNGSGKSTLLRIITGLLEPDSGTIRCAYAPGNIAFLGHNLAMKKDLSVFENLVFWRDVNSGASSVDVFQALKQFNLSKLAEKRFHTLSAGQKRRTYLASLLIKPKPVWLLDEPFTSLDTEGEQQVRAMVCSHLQQNGVVILTSHQPLKIEWPSQHSICL